MSFMQQADAQYAHEKGRDNPDMAWIVSDRDVIYANPFYKGPPVPHPDDSDYGFHEEMVAYYAQLEQDAVEMCGLEP